MDNMDDMDMLNPERQIPKELANVIGLKDGTNVKMAVKEKKLIIEPASS